jgi:hypothetical protein
MQLLATLDDIQVQWSTSQFTGSYADAREQAMRFAEYKQTIKRTWVAEKQDIATLFGNVQTKLKTYRLREYIPPPGLSLTVSLLFSSLKFLLKPRSFNRTWMLRGISSFRAKYADNAPSTPRSESASGNTYTVSR